MFVKSTFLRAAVLVCASSTLMSSTAWAGHFGGGGGFHPAAFSGQPRMQMRMQAAPKARQFNAPVTKATTFAQSIEAKKKIERRGDLPKQSPGLTSVSRNEPGQKKGLPFVNGCEACPPRVGQPKGPVVRNWPLTPGPNAPAAGPVQHNWPMQPRFPAGFVPGPLSSMPGPIEDWSVTLTQSEYKAVNIALFIASPLTYVVAQGITNIVQEGFNPGGPGSVWWGSNPKPSGGGSSNGPTSSNDDSNGNDSTTSSGPGSDSGPGLSDSGNAVASADLSNTDNSDPTDTPNESTPTDTDHGRDDSSAAS